MAQREHLGSRNMIVFCLGVVLVPPILAGPGGGSATAQTEPKREVVWPGITSAGTVLLPNGWALKPAGRQARLGDLPVQIAVHPTDPILAIVHAGYGEHEVITVAAESGKVIGRVSLPETFGGLAWSKDGKQLYVGGGYDDVIYRFDHAGGLLSSRVDIAYPRQANERRVIGGLALSRDGKTLWAANVEGHSVACIDAEERKVRAWVSFEPDSYPYGLALDESRGRLYVSLWNRSAVAFVDTQEFKVVATIATQEHPNELLLARGGKLLYVANANRNTVTVIDTVRGKAVETINTAIDPKAPAGSTPSSLALTPDESILLVANANTNNLAVINVKEPGASTPLGFIPTGWYPTSARVSHDGKTIYVTNGKGQSSRANREGPNPAAPGGSGRMREYIGGLFEGTLSIIPMPRPPAWESIRGLFTSAVRSVAVSRWVSAASDPPWTIQSPAA